MKPNNILYIVTGFLWIVVAMLIEWDYRSNDNAVLSTFSPLQWFVLSIAIYIFVVVINLALYKKEFKTFYPDWDQIMIFIPITNILALLFKLILAIGAIIVPIDEKNEFEQDKSDDKVKNEIDNFLDTKS